jgi:hypothetical protein
MAIWVQLKHNQTQNGSLLTPIDYMQTSQGKKAYYIVSNKYQPSGNLKNIYLGIHTTAACHS